LSGIGGVGVSTKIFMMNLQGDKVIDLWTFLRLLATNAGV
jgi:hypothetical protein